MSANGMRDADGNEYLWWQRLVKVGNRLKAEGRDEEGDMVLRSAEIHRTAAARAAIVAQRLRAGMEPLYTADVPPPIALMEAHSEFNSFESFLIQTTHLGADVGLWATFRRGPNGEIVPA